MRKLALTLTILVSSCTSITDVSFEDSAKINKSLVLTTKALFVCAKNLGGELKNQLVINHGFKQCQSGKHLVSIPANSILEITKVIKHNHTALFSRNRWLVLGNFKGKEFYYQLGWIQKSDGSFLKQANDVPWR